MMMTHLKTKQEGKLIHKQHERNLTISIYILYFLFIIIIYILKKKKHHLKSPHIHGNCGVVCQRLFVFIKLCVCVCVCHSQNQPRDFIMLPSAVKAEALLG